MSASAGRVLLKPKGPYNALTAYTPLDYVTYTDGNTYVCHTPTTGHAPTDTNYWQILVDNSGVVHTVDIANNLTTQTAGKVLDASQGYALNNSLTQKAEPPISIDTGTFSSLPKTVSNNSITSDMEVVGQNAYVSNPAAMLTDWTISPANGSVTISGTMSSGATCQMKFQLAKVR